MEPLLIRCNSFKELVFLLFAELEQHSRTHFAMVSYSIWRSRNLKIWQGMVEHADQILRSAVADWTGWNKGKNRRQCFQAGISQMTECRPVEATSRLGEMQY